MNSVLKPSGAVWRPLDATPKSNSQIPFLRPSNSWPKLPLVGAAGTRNHWHRPTSLPPTTARVWESEEGRERTTRASGLLLLCAPHPPRPLMPGLLLCRLPTLHPPQRLMPVLVSPECMFNLLDFPLSDVWWLLYINLMPGSQAARQTSKSHWWILCSV